jgi:phosphoglycolate phosphatase
VTPGATFDVDAVAFDLDGTLLDTIHDLSGAVNAMLRAMGWPELPKPAVRDLVGKGIANLIGRAVALSRGHAPDAAELAVLLARYQALYAERLGTETVPFPGAIEALEALRRRGLRLAVITNKASRFVAPHLEHARMATYFDTAIGGEDAPAKKPDPAPLLLAAQRLGVAPSRMLMVGDSGNDVDAARAAGCPVVVVAYGYREGLSLESLAGDAVVESLAEVPALCGPPTSRARR